MTDGDPRAPAVAGSFYPSDRNELEILIKQSFIGKLGPGETPSIDGQRKGSERAGFFIVPHAGYAYSGQVASHSYFRAKGLLGDSEYHLTVIIFGPNHYGIGSGVALSPSDSWETPLGKLKVNLKLTRAISESSEIMDIDMLAHSMEHSIEVQVPFIQYTFGIHAKVSFVPVCLMLQDLETAREVSDAIYSALKDYDNRDSILILGSSDLTHYESQHDANMKDQKLLSVIAQMEAPEFYTTLQRYNVSACGYGAIAATMLLARKFGKKEGQVLKYATSGDVTGEESSVVGYSAVQFT